MSKEGMKAAKEWFKAHPCVRTINHWRWAELSQSSHEVMSARRDVHIVGHRAVFGGSEMDLRGISVVETCNAGAYQDAQMVFESGGFVTYRAED
jgi:hypothetical protein